MSGSRILAGIACAAALLACGGKNPSGPAADSGAPPAKALRAAAIADEIAQAPDRVDAILAEHDLTQEAFGDLMVEIAGDPVLTRAYEEARQVPDPR